jgi:hypothetical protein
VSAYIFALLPYVARCRRSPVDETGSESQI